MNNKNQLSQPIEAIDKNDTNIIRTIHTIHANHTIHTNEHSERAKSQSKITQSHTHTTIKNSILFIPSLVCTTISKL